MYVNNTQRRKLAIFITQRITIYTFLFLYARNNVGAIAVTLFYAIQYKKVFRKCVCIRI